MYSIKDLLVINQYQAYCTVKQLVNKFPKETVKYKDGSYLVMNWEADNPKPMLCVHLDTVDTHCKNPRGKDFATPSEAIGYDREKRMYYIKEGYNYVLGGDDRAGLYIAIQLLADKKLADKYCFGFFFDEEVGGVGSTEYAKDFPDYEDGVSCFIGLDRRGIDEVALYDLDNEELIKVMEEAGYKRAYGSFTDASNLSFNVACVNLSVGYDFEHTSKEILLVDGVDGTLEVLKTLYKRLNGVYKVEENPYSKYAYSYYYSKYGMVDTELPDPICCEVCGDHAPLYDDDGFQLCEQCLGSLSRY